MAQNRNRQNGKEMAVNIIEQPEGTTIWQVTEEILQRLSVDEVLGDLFQSNQMHLDWWWEQPFFEGDEYAYAPLAFFVSSNVTDIRNESNGRDRMTVQFTIYMEWRSNADSHVGALTKQSFLSFAPFYNAMHRSLQDFKSASMHTALRRVAGPIPVPGIERKGVLLSTTYQCIVYDCTASPERIQAQIKELKIGGHVIEPWNPSEEE